MWQMECHTDDIIVDISHSTGVTYWPQVALHVSHSKITPATCLYHLPWHLCCSQSATHQKTNSTICGKDNIGKYNIFHSPDETMSFIMVKACLRFNIFLLFRTFQNFAFHIYAHKKNKKLIFTYWISVFHNNQFYKNVWFQLWKSGISRIVEI